MGFREQHETLKKKIHSFRIPLSPRGQSFMKLFYFSLPIFGGYFVMDWAISVSNRNLDQHAQELQRIKSEHNRTSGTRNREFQVVLDAARTKRESKQ